MNNVIFTVCLLASLSVAFGAKYNSLRVKFGWSNKLVDKEYYFKLPQTTTEATAAGWVVIERPSGPLPDLQMYCPTDKTVCAMYATSGFVAGLQIAIPVDAYTSLPFDPTTKFVKWSAPESNGEAARDYWTISQFFVSEESLKSGSPSVSGPILQTDGIWVTEAEKLVHIPLTESELTSTTPFNKQNCIPNMGTHYYYNVTSASTCDEIFPWFVLIKGGELVGTGFKLFGKLTETIPKFEIPNKKSVELIVPDRPDCLTEYAAKYGLVSLHVFYVDEPWTIDCEDSDSLVPLTGINAFLLKGIRYGSKFVDGFKDVFGVSASS